MLRGLALAFALAFAVPPAQAQEVVPGEMQSRAIHRRAVEAVVWGMPAVNYERMVEALVKAGGGWNQVVYWSRPVGWKNQTLTPNPSTIYLMPFFDTAGAGPVVLEIPRADDGEITGTILDAWQTALEDVGPVGADKGGGGRYLILPPGYAEAVPDGYIALPSTTNTGFALLRANIGSGSDEEIARAVAYAKRVRLYPLSAAADPPETTFLDAIDTEFDSTIPYDAGYFEALDRFIQREPWLERDKALIDPLKSIGIEQGKPFAPAAENRQVLEEAAAEAAAWLDQRYEGLFTPYYPGRRWALPIAPEVTEGLANNFTTPGIYPVDGRGVFFSFAFSSVKRLGTGQFYLVSIRDGSGEPFDGGSTYRLRVPADAPVQLYWSATVYDRETHALIRDQEWSSRGSGTPGLAPNADGSVDLFFGPEAPDRKASNWVPTEAGRDWEIMFRFYGPEEPLFDKSWVLPDVEKVALP